MKILAALIVLCLSTVAYADTFDATLDRAQAANLAQRDELIATRAELQQVKLKAATAIEENIKQNAAFQGELKTRDTKIAKQAKTLNSGWVKVALFIRFWSYLLGGVGAALYILAFVGGICRPGTALFQLSGKLISLLPAANIVESGISLFHKTTTVRAAVTPIVEPPAVVTRAADNSQVAKNLAAMAQNAEKPATDYSTNVGFHVKPITQAGL